MDITFNQYFLLDFTDNIAAFFVGCAPLFVIIFAVLFFATGSYLAIGWLRRL
jgi:hypothetical protein